MTAKKFFNMAIILILISTLDLSVAFASPLWQYGLEDQSYSEFNTVESGFFETQSVINIGNVNVDSPTLFSGYGYPGYLYTQNPYPEYSHVTTATVESLTFNFTLESDYSQLDLFYGRFGSEIDYIFFDGVEILSVDGTAESQWDLFEIAITGEINAGDHALTLVYGGGDAANGHYIDFIRLENGIIADNYSENGSPAPVPEPGTVYLISSGLVGLLAYRKKFRRS